MLCASLAVHKARSALGQTCYLCKSLFDGGPRWFKRTAWRDRRRYCERWYAGAVRFEFYRFRFQFRAADPLYFPPYKSGNIVRGAFGGIFRKLVCAPDCDDAKTCAGRATCAYARVFEPRAARGEGPSGLVDWPRPFVFRASHLDGRAIREGEAFHFDVHIFDVRDPALPYFVLAFAQLAREGLGPGGCSRSWRLWINWA